MKKWLTFAMSLLMVTTLAMTACTKKEETPPETQSAETPQDASASEQEEVEPVDIGVSDEGGIYQNETIGFEIQLPKDWYVMDVEEMEAMAQENTANNPAAQAMLPYLTQLVVAYDAKNAAEGVGVNTIYILLQEPTEFKDVKLLMNREKENMELSKKAMGTASDLFEISDLEEKTISGKTYYVLSNTFTGENGVAITSDMYCAQLEDGTFLEMSFSYKDEAGKKAAEDAIASIKHTK